MSIIDTQTEHHKGFNAFNHTNHVHVLEVNDAGLHKQQEITTIIPVGTCQFYSAYSTTNSSGVIFSHELKNMKTLIPP